MLIQERKQRNTIIIFKCQKKHLRSTEKEMIKDLYAHRDCDCYQLRQNNAREKQYYYRVRQSYVNNMTQPVENHEIKN